MRGYAERSGDKTVGADSDFVALPESESVEELVELVENKFLELLEENLSTDTPSQVVSQEVFNQTAIARELAPAIDALARLREIAQAIDNTRKVTIH